MKPAACCCTVEITCADMLAELNETLRVASIEHPFRDKMKRFELFSRLGEENFFPTMSAAVSRSLATHPVEWEDWEDRRP